MKNHFLSRFDEYDVRRTSIYSVLALSLLIISMVLGVDKNGWTTFMFFLGVAFFFYAVLRLWANPKYYGIMCIIIVILFGVLDLSIISSSIKNFQDVMTSCEIYFNSLIYIVDYPLYY